MNVAPLTVTERARLYLAKLPPAISGSGGHNATFRAAAVLTHGFALDGDTALALLREWNANCQPPWRDGELAHKINSAANATHRHPLGYLLDGEASAPFCAPVGATVASAPPPPKLTFDPDKLGRIAAKVDGVNADWLAARSPKTVHRPPAAVLHELYRDGEKVVIFDRFKSQGQHLWQRTPPPFDACELDSFRVGKPYGVWVLANPVTGDYVPNDEGKPTRRSWRTVTRWRYLVLESDKADPAHWLAVLAQMPLPVSAIYSSGGKSIHALVRLDAESQEEWNAAREEMMPTLVALGADRQTLSAVRLTRLPGCQRLGTEDKAGTYHAFDEPRLQRLLFLNPDPDGTPIADMPVAPTGYADGWQPADQDGFDTSNL